MGLGATGPLPKHAPLATFLVLCAFLAACTMPPEPGTADDGPVVGPSPSVMPAPSLRLAIGPVASLDPRDLDTPDGLLLASQLFDGLVDYDPSTAETIPAVAESWEVFEGGRRLVFRLREGVTFHDGTPLNADAFVAAWNRLADPIVAKPFAFLLEAVEGFDKFQTDLKVTNLSGVSAEGPLTLEVRLNRAWPDFVALLGHPALSPVPPPAPTESFGSLPIGNGPYRLVGALTPGSPIRLEAYSAYYGQAAVVSSVEYRSFDPAEGAWPEFLNGDLELAEIPAGVLDDATSQFGSQGVAPVARVLYCAFNEKNELFQDPTLRTAVSLGIDRDEIVQSVYARLSEPATSIVPPSIPGHAGDPCGDRCEHDVERASALIRGLPRKSRTFALDYAGSLAGDRLATAVADQLAEVGLTVTPRPHLGPELEDLLLSGEHEMFCLVWVADYPRQQAFLEPLLSSESVDNRAGIEDPEADSTLEEARLTLDGTERERLYAQVELRALTQMHLIPLIWFRSHLAVSEKVQGFELDPLGRYDASRLSISG
ncbi:MAG: ABC transporter substrate-binding protein [Actinomycetota bacterium]